MAGIVIAVLSASEVSVSIAPLTICIDPSQLLMRLEGAGLRVVPAPSERLAVTIRAQGPSLLLRATRQGAPFEREVPTSPDECPAVQRVVVALITSWSRQLPSAHPAEPKRVREPPAAAPVVHHVDSPATGEPRVPSETTLTPPPVAPPLERQPLVVPPTPALVASASPSIAPFRVALDVAALGGGSVGPTPALAGIGQLHVGLSFGRFGALLEGGLQSMRFGEGAGGRIESTTQWGSLSARVRFEPLDKVKLDLALGFRLWNISAKSFNTFEPRSIELLGVGGVLSGGFSFRLIGPLSLQARAFVSNRASRPRFLISGEPVLDLLPWEGGLLLGVELSALSK